MPVLAINVVDGAPVLAAHGAAPDAALAQNLAALPEGAPVVILLHGFRFSPARPQSDPHRHIYALRPVARCRKALSWPRHLGFGRGAPDEGLCIAFGWEACGSIWRAWRQADRAGAALAELVRQVQALRPGPVHVVAHSLGARVALSAICALPAGTVGRVVLMAAAAFRSQAAAALATPAGRSAQFVNVLSRENDLFDALVERFVGPLRWRDRALGSGLGRRAPNWLDLAVDCPRMRASLAALGYRVPPPRHRVCHWFAYLRPGLLALYRDMIRRPDSLPLAMLQACTPEHRESRRTIPALALDLAILPFRRQV